MVRHRQKWKKLSKIIKFHQIQGKISPAQKSGQKYRKMSSAGLLVGFSKNRAKKAHFIWGILHESRPLDPDGHRFRSNWAPFRSIFIKSKQLHYGPRKS